MHGEEGTVAVEIRRRRARCAMPLSAPIQEVGDLVHGGPSAAQGEHPSCFSFSAWLLLLNNKGEGQLAPFIDEAAEIQG